MNIHYVTHVPFEGLGSMEPYFQDPRFTLSHTPLYAGHTLPTPDTFDWLIVMGGPMSIHDTEDYPWLAAETSLIKAAIAANKRVLGVCLGAQLIANALGADVYPGHHREIGWHPITSQLPPGSSWGTVFSPPLDVFHWHGETFDIPDTAIPLASSVACQNQGFAIGTRVVALQFHMETTPEAASALIANCGNELDGSLFVQDPSVMLSDESRFHTLNQVMTSLLMVMETGK